MTANTAAFVQRLVAAFPALEEDYEIHVFNNAGETLPHLFAYMELMDAVVGAYLGRQEYRDLDWAAVLDYLDRQYAEEDDADVRNVIAVSFVEALPNRDQPGYGLIAYLGPHLAGVFAEVRPGG